MYKVRAYIFGFLLHQLKIEMEIVLVTPIIFPQGLVPGMIGVSHGAIQFMVYEEMKNWYNNYRGTALSTRMVGEHVIA